MNARRFNNTIRRRGGWRGRRGMQRNNYNNNKNNNRSNELIVRNIPKQIINDIVQNNPTNRFRKKKNNNRKFNNNNRKQYNTLKKELNEIKNNMTNKVTNINTRNNKKEPRYDLIVSPMQMALQGRYESIYKTPNRITYMSVYSKAYVDTHQQLSTYLFWFPYALNFNNINNNQVHVDSATTNELCNSLSNLIKVIINPDTSVREGSMIENGKCGVTGLYRIIGCTLKLTNLTSMIQKAGSYTVYRLTSNNIYPCLYGTTFPTELNAQDYFKLFQDAANENNDQTLIKQTYSANDKCHINEFNVTEGNNIFQKPNEYLGETYLDSTERVAKWGQNPTGVNISYKIWLPATTGRNQYLVEMWQVVEIIPDPQTNLDSLSQLQTNVMSLKKLRAVRALNPLSKS